MARSRQRKHETAFAVVVATLVAAAWCIYSAVHHDWNSALWTGCVVIGVPCWLFAIKAPNNCGMMTISGRHCPNRSCGVLFGCGNAEGHTWAKFFAHFGWRRLPVQPGASGRRGPSSTPDGPAYEGRDTSNEQRTTRDQIVFWCTMIATGAGLASALTDLAGVITK